LFLLNISSEVKELMDNGLDLFVHNEGPHQIMNLLFEKQVNKVMFGEIFTLMILKISYNVLIKVRRGRMNNTRKPKEKMY